MRKATILFVLAFVMTLCAIPAYADDILPMPQAFYGDLTVNGNAASVGTTVEARGDGVQTGNYNPITTTEAGKYGAADPLKTKLIVKGDIQEGTTITFYVTNANGTAIGGTATFDSGETTKLDLSATISEKKVTDGGGVSGGGGGGGGYDYIETSIFGKEKDFHISDEGEILDKIKVTSEDGSLTLSIPRGTFALDEDDKPLDTFEAVIDESPPDPPANAQILIAYDFGPAGATFDPPITLTWTYDPDELPGAEEDLAFIYYIIDGEWVELDFEIDTVHNTITASIAHFTTFAVASMPPAALTTSTLDISPGEVFPDEKVNVSVLVANNGGRKGSCTVILEVNGSKEAEKSVTIAAGGSDTVMFSIIKTELGTYNVAVDGLTGSFTVKAPPPPTPEKEEVTPPEEEEVTPPEKEEVTPPEKEEVTPPEKEEAPVPSPWYTAHWYYIAIGLGAIVVIIILVLILRRR